MIDVTTIEAYMRDANPIRTLDEVDADELALAVAASRSRRAAIMQAPTQRPNTSPTTPPMQRRRRVWAFAAGLVLILASVGAAALMLRSSNLPATDEPITDEPMTDEPAPVVDVEQLEWTRITNSAVFAPADAAWINDVTSGGPGLVGVGTILDDTIIEDPLEDAIGPGLVGVGTILDDTIIDEDPLEDAVWTSPDGDTWSVSIIEDQSDGDAEQRGWRDMLSVVAADSGLYAVGGEVIDDGHFRQRGLVWTSADGTSWTVIPDTTVFADGRLLDIVEGGPGLVAVGSTGLTRPSQAAVWTSTDGTTWARAEVPVPTSGDRHSVIGAVTVGGPGLVAVGVSGDPAPPIASPDDDAAVWTSPDGSTWTQVPHDETVFGGAGNQAMSAITAGGPGLVAVGNDHGRAAVWTSPDGFVWSRVPHDIDVFGEEILPQWHGYPYVGYLGGSRIGSPMYDVIATDSGLVAVGELIIGADPGGDPLAQATVWISPDGVTWSRMPFTETDPATEALSTPPHMVLTSVIEAGPGLVAVGSHAEFDQGAAEWVQGAAVWVARP